MLEIINTEKQERPIGLAIKNGRKTPKNKKNKKEAKKTKTLMNTQPDIPGSTFQAAPGS